MTATLTAGTSSVAVRMPHLLCLAVAVLLHVAVLALLPADIRLAAPPAPPISVSLIAPPPQFAANPAAMAAAREPTLAKSPERPPLAAKAPSPQTRLQPTPKPRAPAPQSPGERGQPRAAEPAAPHADALAPSRAAEPAPAPRDEPAPAPRDEPAPASKGPPAPAGAEPAHRADATAEARAKLPSGALEAPDQQAQVTPARVEAAYLDNPIEYPRLARRLGEQGTVLLDVHVGADGLPQRIVLKASSGSPRLDQAARETVQRWKFVPAQQGGRPVESWLTVPIRFVLQG
jgi:protein TonB